MNIENIPCYFSRRKISHFMHYIQITDEKNVEKNIAATLLFALIRYLSSSSSQRYANISFSSKKAAGLADTPGADIDKSSS